MATRTKATADPAEAKRAAKLAQLAEARRVYMARVAERKAQAAQPLTRAETDLSEAVNVEYSQATRGRTKRAGQPAARPKARSTT